MKILFVGVFDTSRHSTNTSQLLCLKRLGHEVSAYNYRAKAARLGNRTRDQHLVETIEARSFDLVIYSKCNQISSTAFTKIGELATTCLWFMDPLQTYTQEMREKTQLVDYFCCDKKNVLEEALLLNPNSFHVCEGFDEDVDRPMPADKCHDVSFIGTVYGDRADFMESLRPPPTLVTGCYGVEHAIAVGKSRINLNFCTNYGASDRIYKILAAGGFLLTNDWYGREDDFTDGEDLVIFEDSADLGNKVDYYLKHPGEAAQIAQKGHTTVQKYTRLKWAEKIVGLYEAL